MSISSRLIQSIKVVLPMALLGVGGSALAQTAPAPWHLKGSDTLFDITTLGLKTGGFSPGQLIYDGTGSGNGETAFNNNVQSLAPMSRNFRPNVLTAHPSWAPQVRNVVGLDAAIIVTKNTSSKVSNLYLPQLSTNPTRAKPNNNALPIAWQDGSGFNVPIPALSTRNYDQLLMVILSGVDGTGSLAACSDPRRVQAVQDLAVNSGLGTIDHFYRRDDNSGTTDTFKDKIMLVPSSAGYQGYIGGRFCNGKAIGGIDGATVQSGICAVSGGTCATPTSCGTCSSTDPSLCDQTSHQEICRYNLSNQDLDPIRKPCVPADSTHAATTCTDVRTGLRCTGLESPPNPDCTQGLVVALSDTDPGSTDITVSIANRVKNDASGQSFGYAGKEAANLPNAPTAGIVVNTTSFSKVNVRTNKYMLSRRLFYNWADTNDDSGTGGGGTAQRAAEQAYYEWATGDGTMTPDGLSGRVHLDPIVSGFGFLTCDDAPDTDVGTLSNNLCNTFPIEAAVAGAAVLAPTGNGATVNSDGSAFNPKGGSASGFIPCAASGAGSTCWTTNTTCPANLQCPAPTLRAPHAACSRDSDCSSGHCIDDLAIGVPGTPVGLVCQ
jgi:ABC-type phosphate transport system substrate-binding protein